MQDIPSWLDTVTVVWVILSPSMPTVRGAMNPGQRNLPQLQKRYLYQELRNC